MLSLVRMLLVGVFLVSNYLPPPPHSRSLQVIVHWDWTLAITVTVFGLLGGFTAQHLRLAALRGTAAEAARSCAAMRLVVVSLLGAVAGLACSLLLPLLVSF